jgi:hypothetical protein
VSPACRKIQSPGLRGRIPSTLMRQVKFDVSSCAVARILGPGPCFGPLPTWHVYDASVSLGLLEEELARKTRNRLSQRMCRRLWGTRKALRKPAPVASFFTPELCLIWPGLPACAWPGILMSTGFRLNDPVWSGSSGPGIVLVHQSRQVRQVVSLLGVSPLTPWTNWAVP